MSAEELGELAKVVTLVPVLVSTLLVPASHACVVVLQEGGGLREVSEVWDWSGRGWAGEVRHFMSGRSSQVMSDLSGWIGPVA